MTRRLGVQLEDPLDRFAAAAVRVLRELPPDERAAALESMKRDLLDRWTKFQKGKSR